MSEASNRSAPRRLAQLSCGAAAVALLGGCTTSLSTLPDPAPVAPSTRGIPYRMPAAQYEITVTWTLDKCELGTNAEPQGKVNFDTVATFKPTIIEGESRVIDYRLMTNHFKTGAIKVEFHEKTALVKSINAEIEGKEAEAAGEAIKFGANIARLVTGVPPLGAVPEAAVDRTTPCLDDAREKVAALNAASARIKAIPREAKAIEDRMSVLRNRVIGNRLSREDRLQLEKLQKEADALSSELDERTKISANLRQTLSFSETWRFPDIPGPRETSLTPDQAKLDKWLRGIVKLDATAKFKPTFVATAALTPLVTEASCDADNCGKTETAEGFVFRQPVQAKLSVIAPLPAPTSLLSETVSVPQFGRLRVLPLRSRWGERNTLSATFDSAGVPTMIEYKALNAPGVAMFRTGNDAAAAALAVRGEIQAQRKADAAAVLAEADAKSKAEVDALKHQAEMLEAQAKIETLQKAPNPDLATLQAELAILRLKKEQSDLQTAIRKNETP